MQRDTLRRLLPQAAGDVRALGRAAVRLARAGLDRPDRGHVHAVLALGVLPRRDDRRRGAPDTAFYHVVDRSKPLDAPLEAEAAEPRAIALSAGAQPHVGTATLVCESRSGGRFTLELFDAGGRRVRVLSDGVRPAGRWSETWDGRDRGGAPAAPGLYFARLTGPEGRVTARLVRLAR